MMRDHTKSLQRWVVPVGFILLSMSPVSDAKGSGLGSGMGGMYWAFIVVGLLVIGAVGYFGFQYWRRARLAEKLRDEGVSSRRNAVESYENAKLEEFNSHFARDLELSSKKRGTKVDPQVAKACEFARAGKRKEVFDMIDKNIVDVNAVDAFGRAFLMIGAEIGDSRLCDGLLRRGADVNQRNKFNGATVLHFAYQYEHDSLGLSLVARGADDTIRAIDGRTCYQLRDEDYDVEAGGVEMQAPMPAPRREMNGDGGKMAGKAKPRKDAGKASGGTRRNSTSHDKMGDRRDKMGDRVDKMGDAYPQQYPPGAIPGSAEKYRPQGQYLGQ